jgi:branched-chain amino acid transport system substrate-binding protein
MKMQGFTQIAAAAVLAFGFTQGAMAQGVVKIGVAGPMTGSVAQYGDMVKLGVDAAVANINKAGGVNGSKLQAVYYDDACDPKQAVAVANKIVNDKVKFVVGHVCSGATQPATDVYEDEGVLMVTPSATAPAITDRGLKLIFRTIGLDSVQGPVAAKYISSHYKGKSIAVLHDKQQYGEGIATAVKKGVEADGVKVAVFEGINAGDKDFNALITKLKRANVDFVYFGGYHPEMGLLLRQASEQGLKVRMMGPEGVGNPEINAIGGASVEGMLVTLPADFASNPKNAAVVKAFKDKKRDPSGSFQMASYTAVKVIAESIKAVGDNADKVAKHLHTASFDTPLGTLAWDAKGDLKSYDFQVFQWHKDGSKTAAAK